MLGTAASLPVVLDEGGSVAGKELPMGPLGEVVPPAASAAVEVE